jgi:hypothetical protein
MPAISETETNHGHEGNEQDLHTLPVGYYVITTIGPEPSRRVTAIRDLNTSGQQVDKSFLTNFPDVVQVLWVLLTS